MVSSRKSRILALSAVLLTLIFVFIRTQQNTATQNPSVNNPNAKISESTTKLGSIDESKIKINEEQIKQKLGMQTEKSGKEKIVLDNKKNEQDGSGSRGVKQPSKNIKEDAIGSVDSSKSGGQDNFDASKALTEILSVSPVVVFSKTYCGYSKALKKLLTSEYEISPAPAIVELDKHEHGRALQDYISQLSGRKTVPNLFVNGVSRGGSDEMKALHTEGKLLASLNSWGQKNIKVHKINAPSNS